MTRAEFDTLAIGTRVRMLCGSDRGTVVKNSPLAEDEIITIKFDDGTVTQYPLGYGFERNFGVVE